MSRFVLSDSGLGNHVKDTKNLLDDVSVVESNVNDQKNSLQRGNNIIMQPTFDQRFVKDFSKVDFKNNQTVVLFTLDSKVEQYNNLYYVKINNISKLIPSDLIVFKFNNNIRYGKLIQLKDKFEIYDSKTQSIINMNSSNILGKLIYIQNNTKVVN